MKRTAISKFVFLGIILLIAGNSAVAQLTGRNPDLSAAKYEVFWSGVMNATTREKCITSRVATVYIKPSQATAANLEWASSNIQDDFSGDNGLIVFFMVDRKLAEDYFQEYGIGDDAALLLSVRALLILDRGKKKKVFRLYPRGLSDEDLDELGKGDRK